LEVRYIIIQNINDVSVRRRLVEADKIIIAAKDFISKDTLESIEQTHNLAIDDSQIWVFGTKDFGYHNGIHHFRYDEKIDFLTYRTTMKRGVGETNRRLRSEWSNRYVDIISLLSDDGEKVLVYTPDGKFISHDTLHLTKYGAIYLAAKLKSRLDMILYNDISDGD
jgi:hypothetical protein